MKKDVNFYKGPPPSAGQDLFPGPVIDWLGIVGDKGGMERVPVSGEPFKEALKLTTYEAVFEPWNLRAEAVLPVAVKKGDVLLAEFQMRGAETRVEKGEACGEFVFRRLDDPWTESFIYGLSAGPQWKKYSIPFSVTEDREAGKSSLCFSMGFRPQVFELADIRLTSYGNRLGVSDLPRTKMTYGGEEPGAPWRAEARERIDRIRKGDLTVSVRDAAGRPLPGVKVSVKMKRHAFGFGTAVTAQALALPGEENERYRKEVERLFNRAVFENDLKWGPWEAGAAATDAKWSRQNLWDAMKWLSERRFDVRGHNMVWGSWKWLPPEVKQLQNDPQALEKTIENRIMDVGVALRSRLVEWDVVNEPVPEHHLTDLLGKKSLVTWYKTARKADPAALLFVNDFPSPRTAHMDAYDEVIRFLLDNGAPLDGIGLQGHVGASPWSIPDLLQTLDRLGAHGLPVEITEYDTAVRDEQLDAQFMGDFLTAVFSHPSAGGFLMWGFWDGSHWHGKAPLFNQDWSQKPSGRAYERLVLRDWWTEVEGTTDAAGSFQTRGFLGDYEVIATRGPETVAVPAKLGREDLQIPVVLKKGI